MRCHAGDVCVLGGSSVATRAPRPFSLLYNATKGKHPDSAKRRFWAIHDHAMPAPVSMPYLLLRRQLLRAGRLAAVLHFEQIVPASVTNQQIGTAFTDRSVAAAQSRQRREGQQPPRVDWRQPWQHASRKHLALGPHQPMRGVS
jgi:hypothetical protein